MFKNTKIINSTSRIFIGLLFGALIVIDIVLVLNKQGYPTFSILVKNSRAQFIWFTFLFGGLIAKVFYNRKTDKKSSVFWGVISYILLTTVLFIIGDGLPDGYPISTGLEICLLLSGALVAYLIWPQYNANPPQDEIQTTFFNKASDAIKRSLPILKKTGSSE